MAKLKHNPIKKEFLFLKSPCIAVVLFWVGTLAVFSARAGQPALNAEGPDQITEENFWGENDWSTLDEPRIEPFDPLEADRPDFTESPTIVPLGRLQLESGWTYYRDRTDNATFDLHTLPEMLFRYGLTEQVELRLAWTGYANLTRTNRGNGQRHTVDGCTDLGVGCKLQVTKQNGLLMESALITSVFTPTGSTPWSSRQVDPGLNYLYGWDLNERLSIAGSTGALWTAVEGEHFTLIYDSIVVGLLITERLGCYFEWFVLCYDGTADDRPTHCLDGGLTYLVTEDFQLDWRIGGALSNPGDDLFTGCGFAVRW